MCIVTVSIFTVVTPSMVFVMGIYQSIEKSSLESSDFTLFKAFSSTPNKEFVRIDK